LPSNTGQFSLQSPGILPVYQTIYTGAAADADDADEDKGAANDDTAKQLHTHWNR